MLLEAKAEEEFPADPGTVGSDAGARGAVMTSCLFEMPFPAFVYHGTKGGCCQGGGRLSRKIRPPEESPIATTTTTTSFGERIDGLGLALSVRLQRFRLGPRSIRAKRSPSQPFHSRSERFGNIFIQGAFCGLESGLGTYSIANNFNATTSILNSLCCSLF